MTTPLDAAVEKAAEALWLDRYPDRPWSTARDNERLTFLGHARAVIEALGLTEETPTIPVFIENVPREMVWRGMEQVPAMHVEFIPHSRLVTAYYGPECPDCLAEYGIHERRQREIRTWSKDHVNHRLVTPWETT